MQPYFYGQGKVLAGLRKGGVVKALRWLLDVSALEGSFSVDQKTHKESYSGQAATAAKVSSGRSGKISMTAMQYSPENVALALHGTTTTVAAGSVSGEALPTGLQVGDIIALDHPNVSDLVITDSASQPVDPAKYELAAAFGSIEWKDVAGLVHPLKAAYKHGASVATSIFTSAQPELFLRYEGINLADEGRPVIAEFYRVSTDPLKKLPLISTDISGMELEGEIMLDPTRPYSPEFGQFGRLVQVQPNA
ncbi:MULTISPECIES: hypothetical protein [Ralstonia solanacearum species complex]|uniref:major tail protein with Ig-like domain n=1 Tax=Ralstonia phage RS138 TaxID=1483485 RepID=UPI0006BD11E9|nr:hypothetical protein [Ralstonia solanacearum]YP_009226548.1 major tail protein with Ig-like domain [Ralstonia phage RS138]BEU73975.1 hypothetical protein MAFF211271_35300 [Ralstonia pseudosolanacearum]AXV78887.1 hypothetical protein CJO76_17970 [Ralstonia solanacearum]AXV92909.1 hypothetical protein CJO79_17955 [Ralstonia solanacearum]AXW20973.1 hypothetical protein CJO85_18000 [Ralstonia solanacearum]AXW77807.1 hypothetical protein CJO97_17950 [Ralstonia solanacearum]